MNGTPMVAPPEKKIQLIFLYCIYYSMDRMYFLFYCNFLLNII